MRHKFTLVLALLTAMAFMLPYYLQVTNLSTLSSRTVQEIIIEPLPQTDTQATPETDQQTAPQVSSKGGAE